MHRRGGLHRLPGALEMRSKAGKTMRSVAAVAILAFYVGLAVLAGVGLSSMLLHH
jgi:pyridoxine 5'-phosphate synthase PdxJ